jgi:hypothetical protein
MKSIFEIYLSKVQHKMDNNGSVTPKIVEKSMKKQLKSFNILFEEIWVGWQKKFSSGEIYQFFPDKTLHNGFKANDNYLLKYQDDQL